MTAVAPAPLGRLETFQWLAPCPLWDTLPVGAGAAGLAGPWIAELKTDSFVDDFTAMLAGASPTQLGDMAPQQRAGNGDDPPYRLFQPLNQRYYLVSATLACRRPGIPDHTVRPNRQERTTFVIRRLTDSGGEQAFKPGNGPHDGWVAADGTGLIAGEEQHPMHPAPVAAFAEPGTTTSALGLDRAAGAGRTVFFGYIPAAKRNELLGPMDDPVGKLKKLPNGTAPDPILSWLISRVIQPWAQLVTAAEALPSPPPKPNPLNVTYASLFVILDLGDWLHQYLPDVYAAIMGGSAPTDSAYTSLLNALAGITDIDQNNPQVSLSQAIAATATFRDPTNPASDLLQGADVSGPSTSYDLTHISRPETFLTTTPNPVNPAVTAPTWALVDLAAQALKVQQPELTLPPELEGMILDRPAPSSGGTGPTYVIRTVFEHPPCLAVLSAPSHPFELAGALDADAPARKILLQMPDITNMRSFKRGVAIEMPPALNAMLARITPDVPDILKGNPPGGNGVGLGWICSFSLQIIFLVAFIVMFIFLILLNIVFWWMAFLKICFPIPVPASKQKGPPL